MGKFTLQSFRTVVVSAALTLTGYVSVAQVSAYTFAQTSGTFTVPTTNLLSTSGTSSTTPGSIFGTAYDDVSTTLTLPFTFNFNGTNYTTITVNTNGFLCFGSAASANTGYTSTNGNYLSGSTVTTNNGLAFFNVDMNERTQTTFSGARTSGSPTLTGVSAASISALTVGMRITGTGIPAGTIITAIGTNTVTMSANATSGTGTTTTVTPRTGVYASFSGASPNRVYSVTYIRTRRYNDATDNVSFQIQLEETTNIIRVVYGPATASATSNNVQVGIRSTTSDFNARKNDVTPNWSSTVAALANTDALTFSSSNFPTSGQTYTWTPYACMVSAPSALSTTTVLATSATITWTAPSPAPGNGYEIYHSTSSTAPTAGTTPTATVGAGVTTVTLNNSSSPAITANTTWYVWVRSNCNGTDKSAWVALPSFNTLEGNTCDLVQDLALLTSPFSGTTVGYTNNFTTSNGSCLTGTGGDRIFKIDVPNNYSLFIGQSINAYDSRHRIAYGGACPGTTEINTGYVANFPTTQTNGVVVGCLDDDDLTHYYFNNTTGSTQTVYWIQDGHLANQGTFTLEWQLIAPPACLAPTALNASPITATSAQINWTAPSPAPGSGYEIYHSTSNTAPAAGTTPTATVAAGVTTVTLNNLSTPAIAASTTYYVWVRSNCNGTDKSAWVALPTFTTPCASITAIPYSESFDAATDPACWSKALLTGSINWAPDTDNDGVPAPRTGARFAGKTWSGNDDALWISPVFDFSSLSSTQTQLSVWIYRNTLDGLSTDRTTFYVNTTPNLSGTPLQLIDISLLGTVAPTVSTSGWYNYTANIPLSYNTGGNFYIIARGRTTSSLLSFGIGFDDFVVEAAPTCFPTPSATFTGTSAAGTNVTWTVPGSGTPVSYDWKVVASGAGSGAAAVGANSGTTTGLTASPALLAGGTTYDVWIRTFCGGSDYSSWSGPFSFVTLPSNDDCATALSINPDVTCTGAAIVSGNIAGSTNSGVAACTGNADDDVWYSFVAEETSHNLTLTNPNFTDFVTEVFSGGCGSLTSISCNDGDPNNLALNGLSVGATYYVRVYSFGSSAQSFANGAHSVCVSTQPRVLGTVTSTQVSSNVAQGEQDAPVIRLNLPVTGAAGTLTINSLAARFNVATATVSDASDIQLWYTGSNTNFISPTLLGTQTYAGTGTPLTFSGLTQNLANGNNYFWITFDVNATATIGNTIDARVAAGEITVSAAGDATAPGSQPATNQNPSGSRTIIAPIPGDACSNAIDLGTLTSPYSSTTSGASDNFSSPCDGGNTSPDLIFYIDVPDGQTLTIGQTTNSFDSENVLRYGGTCPGTTVIACYDDPDTQTNNWTNCTGSTQRVWWVQDGYSGATDAGNFTLAWSLNIVCNAPSALVKNSSGANNINIGWTNNSCSNLWDVYYAVAPATAPTGATTPTLNDVNTNPLNITGLTAGASYSIWVRSDCGGSGTSNWTGPLTVSTAPLNDVCASATPLTVNGAPVTGGIDGAAAGGNPCSSSIDYDVWYQFTPASNGDYVVAVSPSASFDAVFQVLDACGGAVLTSTTNNTMQGTASCIDGPSDGGLENAVYTLTGGTTYYVRVYDYESFGTAYPATTTFQIQVAAKLANDDCAGAIPLTSCAAPLVINNPHLATWSSVTNCASTNDNDLWFSFVANATTMYVTAKGSANYDAVLNVRSGTCNGSNITCTDVTGYGGYEDIVASGLIVGNTYYVRVYHYDADWLTLNESVTLWVAPAGCWLGATDNDWANIDNWSNVTVPNSCATNVTIPSGTPFAPTIGGASYSVGNVNVADGVTITANSQKLSVCGNWNSGSGSGSTFNATGTGSLEFTGTAPQTISGKTNVNVLRKTGASTTSLAAGAVVNVEDQLILEQGNFNTTAGTLTLVSNSPNHAANINDFGSNTGTLTGPVTAQRSVGGAGNKQHQIGSPVVANLGQFGAGASSGYVIPWANCNELATEANSPYGNVFRWDENIPTTCILQGWNVMNSSSAADAARGYSVYLNGGSTLSVTGAPNLAASYSQSGTRAASDYLLPTLQSSGVYSFDAGWNLFSNPFPSGYTYTAQAGFNANGFIYVPSGPFSGSYQPLTPGMTLAPFQGIMLQKALPAGSSATYTFSKANRVLSGSTVFYQNGNAETLEVEVSGNGFMDKTQLSFNAQSTDQFDSDFDLRKQRSNLGQPTIFTGDNTFPYAMNSQTSIAQTSTVDMGLIPGANGTFTFTVNGISSFDPTSYIYLEDKVTGAYQNLRDNNTYTFSMTKTENVNRFVLHFTPKAEITAADANCNANGQIVIEQPGSAEWQYAVNNSSNTTLGSGTLNQSNPLTLSVPAGIYTVTLTDNNGYVVVKQVQVNGSSSITAAGNSSTQIAEVNEDITFTSSTANAVTTVWNFGDGTTANTAQAVHQYQQEGSYTVTLTVTNADGCSSTLTQTITVNNKTAVGISNITKSNIRMWSSGNKVLVDFSKQKDVQAEIVIYDILGRELSKEPYTKSSIYSKEVLNTEAAYVIVKVMNGDELLTRKLFIGNK